MTQMEYWISEAQLARFGELSFEWPDEDKAAAILIKEIRSQLLPEPDSQLALDELAYEIYVHEYLFTRELPEAEPLWQHGFWFGYQYRVKQEEQARINAEQKTSE